MDEKKLGELVKRAREAAGENLQAVILFGSAASGDYDPEFSDLNVFCALRDTSAPSLRAFAPVAQWWAKQKQPPPLVMTRAEMENASDVFTIELLDMQQHHRVLFGDDVLQSLQIPLNLHRLQVEYELREKLVVLREQFLLAADSERRCWKLMLGSLPSFITLFRHALIAIGGRAVSGRRDAVKELTARTGAELSPALQLLDIRQGKANRKNFAVHDLFARHLAAIVQVIEAVDQIPTGAAPAPPIKKENL
jgi:hypothetical protein